MAKAQVHGYCKSWQPYNTRRNMVFCLSVMHGHAGRETGSRLSASLVGEALIDLEQAARTDFPWRNPMKKSTTRTYKTLRSFISQGSIANWVKQTDSKANKHFVLVVGVMSMHVLSNELFACSGVMDKLRVLAVMFVVLISVRYLLGKK